MNGKPRFDNLMLLVRGLFSIPYSNAPIERAFSQLKLIKNKKRLKLSSENLSSLMIVKDTLKRKNYQNSDEFLTAAVLKNVKINVEVSLEKKNTLVKVSLGKKKNSLKNLENFVLEK